MAKLSKKTEELLEKFDEEAKDWGWTSDQGSAKDVGPSEDRYLEAKAALVKRLKYLEWRINKNKEQRGKK